VKRGPSALYANNVFPGNGYGLLRGIAGGTDDFHDRWGHQFYRDDLALAAAPHGDRPHTAVSVQHGNNLFRDPVFPAIADRQLHVSLASNLGRQLKARVGAFRVGRERHRQHGDVVVLPKAASRVHNLLNRRLGLHQR